MVSVLNTDFDYSPTFWFSRFIPKSESSDPLCDVHQLTLGDTLTTNNGIFSWSLQSFLGNQSSPSIPYSGTELDSCDVSSLRVQADARTMVGSITATVMCPYDQHTPIVFTTTIEGNQFKYAAGKQGTGIGDYHDNQSLQNNITSL